MSTRPLTVHEQILLWLTIFCMVLALSSFSFLALTRLQKTQRSRIPPGQLQIHAGADTCDINIPGGTLTIRYPLLSAMGATSAISGKVEWDTPLTIENCSGDTPDWHLQMDGELALPVRVEPYDVIRQPLEGREVLKYEWKATPEDSVDELHGRFSLRLLVVSGMQTLERWNVLARDFSFKSASPFGLPLDLVLVCGAVSALIGFLLLILYLQNRRK